MVDEQPVWAVASDDVVKPLAYVVFVGRSTPVMVTGYELGFVIVATTSPLPPGNSRLEGEGDATALIVRFAIVADWPWAAEPELSPTTQLVAAYAPPPTRAIPATADTIRRMSEAGARCAARRVPRRVLGAETAPLLCVPAVGFLRLLNILCSF